ncbi:Stealth CR1 domain-containing protein [Paeniglutamicibacter sp. Y32M11]|uniref:Stealth CR1 domain-containing protein n=1 Tax=Paeniglutamicibacter sp. Y32M11 TaxID=2853258 RepID=UPI001C5323BC|nr:Stealth CR1 domain-containing protein [Paeniglutamicibacter sp. Y32M11]QXQ08970.1 Stealth CR1 domain-containing protein [Paeniglutamicibacter sp. Y32M11]
MRTVSSQRNTPLIHRAASIREIRNLSADFVRSILDTAGCEYLEGSAYGKATFDIINDSFANAMAAFDASGMIFESSSLKRELHLSLLAHSLRKNMARAISVPVSDGTETTGNRLGSSFEYPIDVVYTWVNSEDPKWKKDYAEALAQFGSNAPPTSSDIVRFQDREELKYSLRSLEMFAPWVNHIYIVTNGQVPQWLDQDNPLITVVAHAEIFDTDLDLPTFNSHAIEANIHRIPGLSEHFLYFNDDVFLGDWCTPETFFTKDGKSKYFESDNLVPADPSITDLPSNWAAFNNKRLLEEKFGYVAKKKFKHTAHAQRLSTLKMAADHFRRDLDETIVKKFRHRSDLALPSNLAHHFGNIIGTAVSADISYRYVDVSSVRADVELSRLLLWDEPTVFCLNQVSSRLASDETEATMIRGFLQNYFPWKSGAELR